ncbi:MAG: AlpA family phage regulatory protein [Alphaproteobacteria bacterium]|nr:AlpA family phage regulatory protein [Alphaproteobacteria bacterium]
MADSIIPWSPYEGRTSIVSRGCKTLTAAFADLVQCRTGFPSYELPEIFAADEDEGENDAARDLVRLNAEYATRMFLAGHIDTFARPIAGGESEAVPTDYWELDDPLPRFATGAFNLERWFDARAEPTHRIFVDNWQFDEWLAGLPPLGPLTNRQIEEIVDPQLRARRGVAKRKNADTASADAGDKDDVEVLPMPPGVGPAFLSVEEVSALIGRSRSTIYQDEKNGTFPKLVKLGSSTRWLKTEVVAWIEEQAAKRDRG